MTQKDKVIQATDLIARALSAIVRINYDNPKQIKSNVIDAADCLASARTLLVNAQEKQQ